MASNRFKMSQERLDALKEELNYLETVREKEVAELIKEARSFGDLSENSEYDEAITLSSVVRLRDVEDDFVETYEIVGSQEANPKGGRISDDSPLGQGLIGHRAGETVTISAPAGELRFEILSVENN